MAGMAEPVLSRMSASPGHGVRQDIQGLRAVAVIAVVANHLLGWPAGGFVGVDVFFVISGFLITASAAPRVRQSTAGFRWPISTGAGPGGSCRPRRCAWSWWWSPRSVVYRTARFDADRRRCVLLACCSSRTGISPRWAPTTSPPPGRSRRWSISGPSRWRSSSICSGRSCWLSSLGGVPAGRGRRRSARPVLAVGAGRRAGRLVRLGGGGDGEFADVGVLLDAVPGMGDRGRRSAGGRWPAGSRRIAVGLRSCDVGRRTGVDRRRGCSSSVRRRRFPVRGPRFRCWVRCWSLPPASAVGRAIPGC